MALTYAQLERLMNDLQRQLDVLGREFSAFRGYVNKQFERIHGRLDSIEMGMVTKQDLETAIASIMTRLDQLQNTR